MIAPPVAQVFATEWPPLVAALMRDLGDLGLAEDSAQDAFVEAASRWTANNMPERPGAWLLTTARRKAIDQLRRRQRLDVRIEQLGALLDQPPASGAELHGTGGDAQLAMIMGCCHRALDEPTQTALTLRYVAGLSTAQIASAFLVPEATMAKRLVRAKAKIAAAGVPFTVPDADQVEERLEAIMAVIYLVFSEGHTSTGSASLLRGDLCDEAAWLAEHLSSLVPTEPEPLGLAALIAFTDARRSTRVDANGDLVLLEDQDRSQWDATKIARGHHLLERALLMGAPGRYQLQAGIAATHAVAATSDATDWPGIAYLYRRLHELHPSPVVALNGAVAVAMSDGAEQGLALVDALAGELDGYRYFHAARADLLRRLDRPRAAADAYRRALELTDNATERRFLRQRLDTIGR